MIIGKDDISSLFNGTWEHDPVLINQVISLHTFGTEYFPHGVIVAIVAEDKDGIPGINISITYNTTTTRYRLQVDPTLRCHKNIGQSLQLISRLNYISELVSCEGNML